jgi:hypothetical protein
MGSTLLLLSGLGAVPAHAAGSITETGWIPLACNINGSIDASGNGTGGIAAHIGTALRVTHDTSLTPGQTFNLTGVSAFQIVPPPAQSAGYFSFGMGDAFAGVVTQFMNQLHPFTMLNTSLTTAGPITSMNVKPITAPLPNGAVITLKSANAANAYQTQAFTLSAAAAFGATTLNVVSQTPNFAYLNNNTQITSPSFPDTATSNFTPGSTNAGTLIDQVAALQLPNTDAQPGGTGSTSTTLTAALANATAGVTTLNVAALPAAIPINTAVTLNPSGVTGTSSQTQTLSVAAAAGATTLTFQPFTTISAYPVGTVVSTPTDKAYVSADASDPAPGQWFSDNLTPQSAAIRQKDFTFGPIPVRGPSDPLGQPVAFGPAPGVGGGVDPNLANDGVPKPPGGLTVGTLGPSSTFTVTGAVGQNVVLLVGDTGRFVNNGSGYGGPLVAGATIFFHNPGTNIWGPSFPVACAYETNPTAANGNNNPLPCTGPNTPAGCYVSAFIIPIVAGTAVPEAPFAIMLPLAGLLVAGIWLAYRRGRPAIQQRP